MADLRGLGNAKHAVEVAAAGGHAVLLSGPKGAGKTSLAERVPGLLPDLVPEEALELTALHSLAGALEPHDDLIVRPPYSAPHHDASKASIVGGGTGQVRPGEISRAHARRTKRYCELRSVRLSVATCKNTKRQSGNPWA